MYSIKVAGNKKKKEKGISDLNLIIPAGPKKTKLNYSGDPPAIVAQRETSGSGFGVDCLVLVLDASHHLPSSERGNLNPPEAVYRRT